MVETIKADLYRYNGSKSLVQFSRVFLTVPGFRFTVIKRVCESTHLLNPLGLIARLWFKAISIRYGFQMPHRVTVGRGVFIGHYGNIVINMGVRIGSNCNLAHGITIGATSRGKHKGAPVIGNRVWIGANAVVVGGITIGDGALIAPLSFVNFNIPANALVIGNPAQIINYTGSEGYVNNILE